MNQSMILTELPLEMLGKIVEKLDPIDRIIARHVCKTLRSIVDISRPTVKTFKYHSHGSFVTIELDDQRVEYNGLRDTCHMKCGNVKFEVKNETDLVVNDTIGFWQNSKLDLLSIIDYSDKFIKELKLPKSSINANVLVFHGSNSEVAQHILSLIKPTVLDTIVLGTCWHSQKSRVDLGKISEMEQWNEARSVNVIGFGWVEPEDIEMLLKFPVVKFRKSSTLVADLVWLRNKLRLIPTCVQCTISTSNFTFSEFDVANALGAVNENGEIRDMIRGSDDFLTFKLYAKNVVQIERKRF